MAHIWEHILVLSTLEHRLALNTLEHRLVVGILGHMLGHMLAQCILGQRNVVRNVEHGGMVYSALDVHSGYHSGYQCVDNQLTHDHTSHHNSFSVDSLHNMTSMVAEWLLDRLAQRMGKHMMMVVGGLLVLYQ
jgi:hypothetical protein